MNGEYVDIGSGEVLWLENFEMYPPFVRSPKSGVRTWDGMSAERLGTYPQKTHSIGFNEKKLLSTLREYIHRQVAEKRRIIKPKRIKPTPTRRIIKPKRITLTPEQVSSFLSILMIDKWADPLSIYNRQVPQAISDKWADPLSTYNTDEYRKKLSNQKKRNWADPNSIFNSKAFRHAKSEAVKEHDLKTGGKRMKMTWKTRREKYGPSGFRDLEEKNRKSSETKKRNYAKHSPRDRIRFRLRLREGWAWKKSGDVFEMLFFIPL